MIFRITRPRPSRLFFLASVSLLLITGAIDAADGVKSPNVVLVMADDLGIGDISPTNSQCKIRTPHLQKMAEEGIGKKLRKIGIQDTFVHGASKPYLSKLYGLDSMALIGEVEQVLDTRFGIEESDLSEAFVAAVHSQAKPEAL